MLKLPQHDDGVFTNTFRKKNDGGSIVSDGDTSQGLYQKLNKNHQKHVQTVDSSNNIISSLFF